MKFINVLLSYITIKVCAAGKLEGDILDTLRNAKANIDKGNVKSVNVQGDGALAGGLYGISLTTTKPPTTSMQSDLPFLPGGRRDDQPSPACLDLMIVIDVSCSIKEEDRIKARDFAADVVKGILTTATVDTRVGLVRYSQTIELVFRLDDHGETDVIDNAIRTMNTSDLGCKTNTHLVLKELYSKYFTDKFGDRSNEAYPNAAILFTDGRTISQRFAPETKRQAKNAEVSDIEIHVVDVPHRQGLGDLADEFDELPTRPELLYDVKKQEDIDNIVDDLTSRYNCGDPDFGGGGDDPSSGCANVIFAIDVSCSIDRSNVTEAISIAKDIIDTSKVGHQFGAFTYDNNTVGSVPYFTDTSAQLNNLDPASRACKTRTNRAITYAGKNYFNNNSSSNVLIIFGDGNESPWRENKLAIEKANAFTRNNKGTLIWVILTSNRDEATRTRGIEEQIKVTASVNRLGTRLVFEYNDADVITVIVNYLDTHFPRCVGTVA
ncbi:unnamed protein product [Owenia fusiformis]|uniref:Uncharacterized protein n=1 Tax=Owenia fusiformis TaxID=6347 RepID=A0A8J1XPG6_OWEFU|nr:unnamed protein product [Owenia fusiformis]